MPPSHSCSLLLDSLLQGHSHKPPRHTALYDPTATSFFEATQARCRKSSQGFHTFLTENQSGVHCGRAHRSKAEPSAFTQQAQKDAGEGIQKVQQAGQKAGEGIEKVQKAGEEVEKATEGDHALSNEMRSGGEDADETV